MSTGQGLLGNNMFAYCNNNPVKYTDKDGKSPDNPAGFAGEAIGEWLYELITGRNHPNKQTREVESQIVMEQNKMVWDASKAVWDAYMRGYNIQKEAQIYNAHMTLDGAITIYNYISENESVSEGLSGGSKIAKGVINVVAGAGLILAPVPTPADDLVGVRKITFGIFNVCYGIAEVIGAVVK